MKTTFERDFQQIKEKVEVLTGERGAAGRPERAVRLRELGTLGSGGGSGAITKLSQLQNDTGFVTAAGAAAAAPVQSVAGETGAITADALNAALGLGDVVHEAPQDGVQYARQDGAWSPVAPSVVPYFIPAGRTYTVPQYGQALFTIPIELGAGASIELDGVLEEVS